MRLTALAAAGLLCLGLSSANAAVCGPWADVFAAIREARGEAPAFIAEAPGGVVTFTVNPETHTWSMVVQPSAERACIIGMGEGWSEAPPSVANPPQPVPQLWRFPDGKGGVLFLHPAGL